MKGMNEMNKQKQRYRAASWWITWEDLSYPDTGVQKKSSKRLLNLTKQE